MPSRRTECQETNTNAIGNVGAIALAKFLETNESVTQVGLRSNAIGNEGAIAIAKALESNKSVTRIDLSKQKGGGIDEEGKAALDKVKALKTLYGFRLMLKRRAAE